MTETIEKNMGTCQTESSQNREIGLKAGVENQRRLRALELGELGLQPFITIQIARHQPRGTASSTIDLQPLVGTLLEKRMLRESQIVIRGKIDQSATLALGDHARQRP